MKTTLYYPILVCTLSIGTALAQDVWDGTSGLDDNWTTGTNWQSGLAPANDGTANTEFLSSNTVNFAPNINTPYSINTLTTDGGFTFDGSVLDFAGANAGIFYNDDNALQTTFNNALTLSGDIALDGDSSGSRIVFNAAIDGGGKITKGFDAALVRLKVANSFSGGLEVSRGEVRAENNSAFGTGSVSVVGNSNLQVTANNNWTFSNSLTILSSGDSNPGGTATFARTGGAGSIGFSGGVSLSGADANSKQIAAESGDTLTLGGAITESGGAKNFRITGAGSVIVNGTGSYTGSTIIGDSDVDVNTGRVEFNNDVSLSSDFTVFNGMTVGGTGMMSGGEFRTGTFVDPGADGAIGTISFGGNVGLLSGSTFLSDVADSGVSDLLDLSGNILTIGSGVTLALDGSALSSGLDGDYVILEYGNLSGVFDTITLDGSEVNWLNSGYTINYLGTQTVLAAIPEPTTALVFGATLVVALARRRRQQQE